MSTLCRAPATRSCTGTRSASEWPKQTLRWVDGAPGAGQIGLAGAAVAAVGVATAGRQQDIGFAILAVQRVERQVSGAPAPARRTLQQPAGGKAVAGGEVVGGPGEGAVGIALRELPPHLLKERNRSSLVGSPDVAFADQVDDWRGRAGAVASLPGPPRHAVFGKSPLQEPRATRTMAASRPLPRLNVTDMDGDDPSSCSNMRNEDNAGRVPPQCAAPLRQSLLQAAADAPLEKRRRATCRPCRHQHDCAACTASIGNTLAQRTS